MSKSQTSSKDAAITSRKRKHCEIEEEPVSLKRVKFGKDEEPVKKDEEDYEERQIVKKYLSENAASNYEQISDFMNEFNCDSHEMQIYSREYEKAQIKGYIENNFQHPSGESKSGLMYVCGHPGTGKSSIIRVILKEFEEKIRTVPEYK